MSTEKEWFDLSVCPEQGDYVVGRFSLNGKEYPGICIDPINVVVRFAEFLYRENEMILVNKTPKQWRKSDLAEFARLAHPIF